MVLHGNCPPGPFLELPPQRGTLVLSEARETPEAGSGPIYPHTPHVTQILPPRSAASPGTPTLPAGSTSHPSPTPGSAGCRKHSRDGLNGHGGHHHQQWCSWWHHGQGGDGDMDFQPPSWHYGSGWSLGRMGCGCQGIGGCSSSAGSAKSTAHSLPCRRQGEHGAVAATASCSRFPPADMLGTAVVTRHTAHAGMPQSRDSVVRGSLPVPCTHLSHTAKREHGRATCALASDGPAWSPRSRLGAGALPLEWLHQPNSSTGLPHAMTGLPHAAPRHGRAAPRRPMPPHAAAGLPQAGLCVPHAALRPRPAAVGPAHTAPGPAPPRPAPARPRPSAAARAPTAL